MAHWDRGLSDRRDREDPVAAHARRPGYILHRQSSCIYLTKSIFIGAMARRHSELIPRRMAGPHWRRNIRRTLEQSKSRSGLLRRARSSAWKRRLPNVQSTDL